MQQIAIPKQLYLVKQPDRRTQAVRFLVVLVESCQYIYKTFNTFEQNQIKLLKNALPF